MILLVLTMMLGSSAAAQDEVPGEWPLDALEARGMQGVEPIVHQTLLAYISDHTLLGAALLPHPATGRSDGMALASLDHAIWFHQPCRTDQWLLYHQDSPIARSARGFSRGTFFTQDGRLVASTVQESLQRKMK